MPGFPASYLVFVQSEPTFGLLEARLDPPAAARDANQLLERRALRGEHHVVGELSRVFQAATHEQQVLEAPLFFGNLQPEQWQERPVVEARTFGSVSRRETFPLARSRSLREHVSPDLPRWSTICVPLRLVEQSLHTICGSPLSNGLVHLPAVLTLHPSGESLQVS